MPIHVSIIEDNPDYRETLKLLISETEGFRCVSDFESVEDALRALPQSDILLLDINLPGASGIEALPKLKAKHPAMHIVMLTLLEDPQSIAKAILSGASGYILKRTIAPRILMALEDAMEGGMPLSPSVARIVGELYSKVAPKDKVETQLTARELEILQLMGEGLAQPAIAEKLFLSYKTVRNHVQHIYDKLHVHSQSEAISKALKSGMI